MPYKKTCLFNIFLPFKEALMYPKSPAIPLTSLLKTGDVYTLQKRYYMILYYKGTANLQADKFQSKKEASF